MILYTIMRPEAVFQELGGATAVPFKELVLEGIRVEVSESGNQTCIVQRILSTNPADYLHPALQPGSVLHVEHTPKP
jgi:hypothetical protein